MTDAADGQTVETPPSGETQEGTQSNELKENLVNWEPPPDDPGAAEADSKEPESKEDTGLPPDAEASESEDDGKSAEEKAEARRQYERRRRLRAAREQEATQTEEPPSDPDPATEVEIPPVRTLADFDGDEKAFQDYSEKRVAAISAQRQASEAAEQAQRTEAQQRRDQFLEREADFIADNDISDYDEVTRSQDLPITREMAQFIQHPDNELGPELAYHLGKHPEEAARIASLSDFKAQGELRALMATLQAKRARLKAERDKPSGAPPPPDTVDGSGEVGIKPKPTDPGTADSMSDEQWARERNRQIAARRAKRK